MPWNLHEPYPGEYTWTGFADVELFLQLAQASTALPFAFCSP